MKSYGRRDFLRALGVGAAAAVVAPQVLAEKVYPAGSKIAVEIENNPIAGWAGGDVWFPWEFYGDYDFPPCHFGSPETATHVLVQTEEPPEGYVFFAENLSVVVREDCKLEDLQTFVETWLVSLKSGHMLLFEGPVYTFFARVGSLGHHWGLGRGPRIPVPPGLPLEIAVHGKPFRLSGQLLVAASIGGVAYESTNVNPISLKLTPEAKHAG